MKKEPTRLSRKAHTKQKPKPRYVSKAHLQERQEDEAQSRMHSELPPLSSLKGTGSRNPRKS